MIETYADKVLADRLKGKPNITQLPDGGFAVDVVFAPKGELTKDWLVLKHCTGSGGRLVLSGALNVPDAVLPRLTPSDLEGFSKWTLVDRCQPGKGQFAEGSVMLSLTPGYGASEAKVQPVKAPTIPLKFAKDPDTGSNIVYQILNDPLGIYQDQDKTPEYHEIYIPSIPGLVEVKLNASAVRKIKPDFSSFAVSPYPLRIRFYTSGGVREYEFKAPLQLPDFIETQAEAIERINNCEHRGSSLVLKNYLELLWLGNPAPIERGNTAQQWDLHVRGLEQGRKVTVWNQDTGEQLVQAFADQTNRVDVSLMLQSKEPASALLIGLDDKPFLTAKQVRSLSVTSGTDAPLAPVQVVMRQTLLTEIDHMEFDEPIEALQFADAGRQSVLLVRTARGQQLAHSIPAPYSPGLARPMLPAGIQIVEQQENRSGMVSWRGKHRRFTHLSQRFGRMDVVAEYSARSSYDLAAGRDDLFAQASTDGLRVTLFQKSAPVQFGTQEWQHATKNVPAYRPAGATR